MAIDKVRPLKLEDPASGGTETDEFPTSLDPQEDHIQAAGVVFEDATHSDETTRIWRDGADMKFMDGNNPSPVTLSDLTGGGSINWDDMLLDVAGTIVYNNDGNVVTRG